MSKPFTTQFRATYDVSPSGTHSAELWADGTDFDEPIVAYAKGGSYNEVLDGLADTLTTELEKLLAAATLKDEPVEMDEDDYVTELEDAIGDYEELVDKLINELEDRQDRIEELEDYVDELRGDDDDDDEEDFRAPERVSTRDFDKVSRMMDYLFGEHRSDMLRPHPILGWQWT